MMNDRPQFDRAQSLSGKKWRPYATLEDKLFRKERAREFHRMGGRRGIPQEPKPCKCGCEGSRVRHYQLRTVARLDRQLGPFDHGVHVLKRGISQGDPWRVKIVGRVIDVIVGDGNFTTQDKDGRWTSQLAISKR